MHNPTTLLLASLAALAASAPITSGNVSKRSFAVSVKGRALLAPAEAMARAYYRYSLGSPVPPAVNPFASESEQPSGSSPFEPAFTGLPFFGNEGPGPELPENLPTTAAPSGTNIADTEVPTTSTTESTATGSGGKHGEVNANPESNDSEYLEAVTIGGQQLDLDFDTGSADLWVFSTELPESESSGHTAFNPSKSSTWTTYQGSSWSIQYGDASTASGNVGFDTVSVGGVRATHQAVELATTVSSQFEDDRDSDGLLGLGFSNINQVRPQPQKTFFENVMPHLALPVFTADLDESASGTYEFGSIDSSKYTGDIHWTAVDSSHGYWQFAAGGYAVNGVEAPCQTCSPAIADTGTSLMLVDDEVASAFYSAVEGAQLSEANGGFIYPCSSPLPDLAVSVGDYLATLSGSNLTYMQIDDTMCFGGVQSNSVTAGETSVQIYGDVFLKQVFAVFDGGNTQFGVAQKS